MSAKVQTSQTNFYLHYKLKIYKSFYFLQTIGSVLKDIYSQLKIVVNYEKDEVTLNYALAGLNELDAIMKDYLFPEQELKKKIQVLKPSGSTQQKEECFIDKQRLAVPIYALVCMLTRTFGPK